jgi:hypothetical protein
VLGTIGWIAAGFVISALGAEARRSSSAWPPRRRQRSGCSPSRPLRRRLYTTGPRSATSPGSTRSGLKERSFAIFVLGSFSSASLQFYYAVVTNPYLTELGVTNSAAIQTMGQMSEIGFMLVMPFFFSRLGVKWMLIVGMGSWALRYVFFAFATAARSSGWSTSASVHGICYDFFFVTGQIYMDKKAPLHIRAAAQGFMSFVTYGAGMFVGSYLAGWIVDQYTYTRDGTALHTWQPIWLIPAACSTAVLLLFALFFRHRDDAEPSRDGVIGFIKRGQGFSLRHSQAPMDRRVHHVIAGARGVGRHAGSGSAAAGERGQGAKPAAARPEAERMYELRRYELRQGPMVDRMRVLKTVSIRP